MKSIAFSIQKGGQGKTSLSVTTAAQLAKHGKTILIDSDPQGSATSWILPIETPLQFEVADYLFNDRNLKLADIIKATAAENLDILPTLSIGTRLTNYAQTKAPAEPFAFMDLLAELERLGYDFAIFDLSPYFGIFERNILTACNEVITPVIPDFFGVDGIEIFINNLLTAKKQMHTERPAYKRIFINAKDERIEQYERYTNELKANLSTMQFYQLGVEKTFRKAQELHAPIQTHKETSKATLQEVERLAMDIINGGN